MSPGPWVCTYYTLALAAHTRCSGALRVSPRELGSGTQSQPVTHRLQGWGQAHSAGTKGTKEGLQREETTEVGRGRHGREELANALLPNQDSS